MKLLTIGIPVRNEEDNISQLIIEVENLENKLSELGIKIEIVVNDNASTDSSLRLLKLWQSSKNNILINIFPYPIPFQSSVQELMKSATGDGFVILQSDLQDPPHLVLDFIKKASEGHEIVAGVIQKRNEGLISRGSRKIFYFLLKKSTDGFFIENFQDFYFISRNIYLQLLDIPKEGLFLRGHLSSRFGVIATIPYIRRKRSFGKSKFNFSDKYSFALDGLLLFGTRFVRNLSVLSFFSFLLSILLIFAILIAYAIGYKTPTGWASLSVVLLSLLSMFGLAVGLILEYSIRIYRTLILSKNHVVKY